MRDGRQGDAPAPGLSRLALPALLLSFLGYRLLPLYTDEIGWRFQRRAAIDGGVDVFLSDICGPNTLAPPPGFMMPMRWVSAWANGLLDTPWLVRLTGVTCAIAGALLLRILLRRIEPDRVRRADLAPIAFALLGLGVLPALLVLSRPEQPLLLGALMVLIIAFAPAPDPARALAAAWRRSLAIVAVWAVALSYHPKSVPFAGIALAALLVCARGRGTALPRLAGAAALLGLIASAGAYWTERFRCPDDPVLAGMLAHENVIALLARGSDAGAAIGPMIGRLVPLGYIRLVVPPNEPLSHWLPDGQFAYGPLGVAAVLIQLAWRAALLLAVLRALGFVLARRGAALAEPRLVVAAALFGCCAVWSANQINQPPYDAALMMPLLALGVALCLALPLPPGDWRSRAGSLLARVLVPLALLSQAWVAASLLPGFAAAARTPGAVAGQPFSVSLGDYAPVRRDIDRAMAAAGFPRGRRLRHLLIDDLTYLSLQHSYQPFHYTGVLQIWRGRITDPLAYLRSRGSDGLVVGCPVLPPALRRLAHRSGPVCALALGPSARPVPESPGESPGEAAPAPAPTPAPAPR